MRLGMGLGLGNLLSGGPITGMSNKYSFNFDGSNDYLQIDDDALAGKSQGTISFWTKTSGTGSQAILGYHRDQWSIRFNKTTMFLGIGGTTVTASSSLDNSDWGFHTITFNSGTAKFYKDGALYDTDTSFSGSFPANTNGIFVGKRNHASGYYYNGLIDEVSIWDVALSDSDVAKLASKPVDLSKASTYDTDRTSSLKLWLRAGDKVLPEEDASIARSDFYTDFDSTDDYINVGSDSSIDNVWTGGGTLTSWIYPRSDGESDFGRIAIKRNGESSGWIANVMDESSGVCDIRFYSARSGTNGSWNTTAREVTINQWNHVAVSYDSDSASNNPIIYINGVSVGLTANATASGDHASDASDTLYLGGEAGATTFDGAISNLTLHQTILDAQTIKQFAKSRFTPMRDNRFSVVDFDGTNDYVDCGTGLCTSLGDGYDGGLSVSMWFKADVTSGVDDGLFNFSSFGGSSGELFINLNGNNINVRFADAVTSITSFTDIAGWHHLVAVYDGSNNIQYLYLDGVSKDSDANSNTLDLDGLKTIIGGYFNSSYVLNGKISSVAVYNVAKSADEVYAIYQQGITYDESSLSGLVGYWRMGDDTSKAYPTVADSSSNSNDGTITNGASDDIQEQMVAGYDMGAFESTGQEVGGEIWDADASTFDSGTHSWVNYSPSANGMENDSGALKITRPSSGGDARGAYVWLKDTSDLSINLTVGKKYILTFDAKVNSGSSVDVIVSATATYSVTVTETSFTSKSITFVSTHATDNYFAMLNMDANEIIHLDNLSLIEVIQSANLSDTYPAIIDVNEPVLGAELITNGTMEADSNWATVGSVTNVQSDTQVYAGSYSRKVVHSSNSGYAKSDTFTTTANKSYKIELYVYPDDTTTMQLTLRNGAGDGWAHDSQITGLTQDAWNLVTVYYTEATGKGGSGAFLGLHGGDGSTGTWYFDNASIKQLQGNTGTMTNQAADDLVYSSVLPDQSFLTGVNSAYNFIDLDGSDEYIDTGSPFESLFKQSFTLSAWVKIDDGQPSAINVIFSTVKQWSGYIYFQVEDDGRIKFVHGTHHAKELNTYTDSAVFADGASDWTHVAGVFSRSSATSGSVTIYVNGSSAGSNSSPAVGWNADNYDNNLYNVAIGSRNNEDSHDRFFSGDIGQTAIYSKALSASEISGINTLGRHGNLLDKYSEGLKAYYAMSSLDASTGLSDVGNGTIYDRSGQSNHGTATNTEAADLASSPNAEPNGYAKGDTNRSTTIP